MNLSYKNFKSTSNKVYDAVKDKKTRSAAIMLGIYNIVLALFPNSIDLYTDNVIRKSIDFVIIVGGADWAWRNRHKVVEWIEGIINSISNKLKK